MLDMCCMIWNSKDDDEDCEYFEPIMYQPVLVDGRPYPGGKPSDTTGRSADAKVCIFRWKNFGKFEETLKIEIPIPLCCLSISNSVSMCERRPCHETILYWYNSWVNRLKIMISFDCGYHAEEVEYFSCACGSFIEPRYAWNDSEVMAQYRRLLKTLKKFSLDTSCAF